MKDTFTLWGVQCRKTGAILDTYATRRDARRVNNKFYRKSYRVVKLECRVVQPQRKPKRGKYPNDNFGLPSGYTPHNPDNLTREQVGEGFRLLAKEEIWGRPKPLCSIDAWLWPESNWGSSDYIGNSLAITYRVPVHRPLDINPELKTK